MSNSQTQIMLVDDSAVIRAALSRIIESDSDMKVVSSVANGEMAVSSAKNHQPDVVILDIEMPVMDGLTALPKILQESPESKIIMFSSLTEKGASVTMKAMSLGAVECLVKPSSAQDVGEGSEFQVSLARLLKNLSGKSAALPATVTTSEAPKASLISSDFELYDDSTSYKGKPSIIAIGSSTGGPKALFEVISHFKTFDIPIVITQHMPATFTTILASHITEQSGVDAVEAEEGMLLEKGKAYVAPGGFHMKLVKDGTLTKIHIDDGPQENFCKPAVDPMMRSVVDIYGNRALGVVLTGMGSDGLKGMQQLVEAGGRLVAQDEATSVVWGMPGAVATAGICSKVLPLNEIGPWVKQAVMV